MRLVLSLLLFTLACNTKEREPAPSAPPTEKPAALELTALRYHPTAEEHDVATAQALLAKTPELIDGWEQLAIALIRRGRETANPEYAVLAGDLIAEARKRFPREPRIEILHLMMLLDEHRFREARDLATAVVQQDQENVTALILLGDAQLELGAYDDALSSYQRAMDLRPDLRSYNRGAYLRWLSGEFDGAMHLLELAVDAGSARDPEPRAWCYTDVARMYLHRGDAPRTLKAVSMALELVPSYVAALSVKARALVLQGDRKGAIALLEQTTAKKAETSDLLLLSELALAERDGDKAEKALERATKLAEHDPRPFAHFLARFQLEPEKALALATRAREERPTIEADDTYALAALRAKKLDEAAKAIERATSFGTLDANFWLHRALIEAARGKPKEAKQSLQQALELNPKVDPMLISEAQRVIRP